MKKHTQYAIILALVLILLASPVLTQVASSQWVDPPIYVQPTPQPWDYAPYDPNDEAQETPVPGGDPYRPLLYIVDYHTDLGGKSVNPYGTFDLTFTIGNNAKHDAHAYNIVVTFSSQDFDPLDGSVITFYEIDAENKDNVVGTHKFKVNEMSTWKYSGQIQAVTTYTDPNGTPYSDTFIFTIIINQTPGSGTGSATATPAAVKRPQIVINKYETDVDPLQPGTNFKLKLDISNAGSADARTVSMVFGGASMSVNPAGTPEVGSLAGNESSVFAPIGKSNVILLGDIPMGGTMSPEQEFIVNVTATPGAYPLKVSFVYIDPKGNRVVDDQVITLLIFSLPQLEISFYQPVDGMMSVDMPSPLPIQITNLARKSVVLGNVVVTSENGMMSYNTVLVGTLEPGGYFTLDPMFIPEKEGPTKIKLEIRYTDDFNQLRTYNGELTLDVMGAMPTMAPFPMLDENGNPMLDDQGNPIMIDPNNPSSFPTEPVKKPGFFARIWNAIKGFFGFGTSNDPSNAPMYEDGGNMNGGSSEGIYFETEDGGGMIMP